MSSVSLTKPVVLVAGGSRGIGAAIAVLAGERGYSVAVNFNRDAKRASDVVSAIRATGSQAISIQGDMASEQDSIRVFETVDKEFGSLTNLVFNCAVIGKPSRIDAVETKTLKDVLALNVFGALVAARESVKRISTKHNGRGGSIVFISSVAATLGSPSEFVWYAASKGAIDTLTIGLARELAEDDIRVNGVSPGSIATEIQPPGRLERVLARVPMRRAGKPEDIAEAVLFLMSPASSYTTGAILRVSGGR